MGPVTGSDLMVGVGMMLLLGSIPTLIAWTILHLGPIGRGCGALLRRLHLLKPPRDPSPARIPLERLAADLCRLATAMRDVPRGTSRARLAGLRAAYDDVLAAAALALDVPHTLADLPPGLDRDLERLRVESLLADAGLVFGPRKRQDTP